MPFKFKDLVVTMVPGSNAQSGGSGGSGGTVGSCTSECGPNSRPGNGCGLSDEFLDPLEKVIDPQFMVELRMLVRLAVARSYADKAAAIEAAMHPKTVHELDTLEKQLKEALTEVSEARRQINPKGS